MITVGSARSSYGNERPGDQNGKEVSTQNYYSHSPYWLAFEPIDTELGIKLAQAMIDACNNNNFGYSQNTRMTGRQAVVKYGSIKSVKEPCNVDCSSLVNLCLYVCGYNVANFNTATEPSVLRKTGLFKEKQINSEKDIHKVGTILVTPNKGHTLIVTNINGVIITVPSARPNLKKGSKGKNVEQLQQCLNRVINSNLDIDGDFGPKTEKALKDFQKKYKIAVDGIYGKESKAKLQEVL